MRLTILIAIAALLTPLALTAHPAVATGVATQITDLSAAKKSKKPKKQTTEENLKAAPSAPPSGGKSTY
jgi:hypothetical protein